MSKCEVGLQCSTKHNDQKEEKASASVMVVTPDRHPINVGEDWENRIGKVVLVRMLHLPEKWGYSGKFI